MAQKKAPSTPIAGRSSMREWERWVLCRTLESTNWNISEAARVLGVGRSTLHRQLKLLDLRPMFPRHQANNPRENAE